MFALGEAPIWVEEHNAFYWEDQFWKQGGLFRLKNGSVEIEKMNLPHVRGALPHPNFKMGAPNGLGAFYPTKTPDVFIAAIRRGGLAKMTMTADSTEVKLEMLGINPLKQEKHGGGRHPGGEYLNDGKVSPDGHFFMGTCDFPNLNTKDENIRKYFWTNEGNNTMAPYLYRFDIDKKSSIV